LKDKTNVGSMSYFQRWDGILTLIQRWYIYINSILGYWCESMLGYWLDPTSEQRPTLHQHWTNEQNDVGPMLYCNVAPTNWWRYPNIGPTNDCYLGVYFFKYRLSVFFNLYLFKVSSKSTFSLLFGDLWNIGLFFTFLSIDSQTCPSPTSLIGTFDHAFNHCK